MDTFWKQIVLSELAWEREALAFVRRHLPDRPPYRAWANFERMVIIKSAVHRPKRVKLPEPVHLRKPLTQAMLNEARREGRA